MNDLNGENKGNRLNTAANVGSFVTGRQQLAQQRTVAINTAVTMQIQQNRLAIQRQQAYEADYDRLLSRTDRAAGRGHSHVPARYFWTASALLTAASSDLANSEAAIRVRHFRA
jgi:hypothetical protein